MRCFALIHFPVLAFGLQIGASPAEKGASLAQVGASVASNIDPCKRCGMINVEVKRDDGHTTYCQKIHQQDICDKSYLWHRHNGTVKPCHWKDGECNTFKNKSDWIKCEQDPASACELPSQSWTGIVMLAVGHPYIEDAISTVRKVHRMRLPALGPAEYQLEMHLYVEDEAFADVKEAIAGLERVKVRSTSELGPITDERLTSSQKRTLRWWKLTAIKVAPFDRTIYMDADLKLCGDGEAELNNLIHSSKGSDLFLTLNPKRFNPLLGPGVPALPNQSVAEKANYEKFAERNSGFIIFDKRSLAVRELLADWRAIYAESVNDWNVINQDQGPFRLALWKHRADVSEKFCDADRCCRFSGHSFEESCAAGCVFDHSAIHEDYDKYVVADR